MSQRVEIQKLIIKHQRRLQKLKEKEATSGINTPPEILTEIEDIETEIDRLQAWLADSRDDERSGFNGNLKSRAYLLWIGGVVFCIILLALSMWIGINWFGESRNSLTNPPIRIELYQEYWPAGGFILQSPPRVSENYQDLDVRNIGQFSTPQTNYLAFSVVSLSNSEYVALSDDIPFKLLDYSKVGNVIDAYAKGGGAGYSRDFRLLLSSAQQGNIVRAPYDKEDFVSEETSKDAPDYFSLQPGEREVFIIEVTFDTPGVYTFQAGIEYFYQGKREIIWWDQKFVAMIPDEFNSWRPSSSGNWESRHCVFADPTQGGWHAYECSEY